MLTETFWVQMILNALVMGSAYMLIGSGLTLIFSIMKIMNFAHGELYMLGGFTAYYLFSQYRLNYFVVLIIAVLGMVVIGLVLERLVFRAMRTQPNAAFMVSLGLVMLLSTIGSIAFGADVKPVAAAFSGRVAVLGATLSAQRLAVIPLSIITMLGLYLLLYRTRLGMSMRAVSEDAETAAVQGIRIDRMSAVALGVGSALAAVAGALMAPIYFVSPFMGFTAALKACIIVVFGGLGSLRGAIVAAYVLGIAESFAMTMVGGWASLVGWAIVAIILLVKPLGLFGREEW